MLEKREKIIALWTSQWSGQFKTGKEVWLAPQTVSNIDSRKLNFCYMLSNCKQTWSFVYLRTYKHNTCSPIVFIEFYNASM